MTTAPIPSAFAPFDPVAAVQYGLFVKEAYAMYQAAPGSTTPAPTANFPKGYRLSSWITMQDFVFESTPPQFYGFIAQSAADPNRFVLAIRGTSSATEWWDDLNAVILAPFKVPGFGRVGDGFAKIYETLHLIENPPSAAGARSLWAAGGFAAQVEDLVARHAPDELMAAGGAAPAAATVEVVGHSLGSALATLYIADSANRANLGNPALCTFASPMVGDQTFVNAFGALDITSWRVAISSDVVTMLPPANLGFVHVTALTDLKLPWDSRWYWPPCAHVLLSYLHLLDPTQPSSSDCTLTFGAERAIMSSVTAPPGLAAMVHAAPTPPSIVLTGSQTNGVPPTVNITVHASHAAGAANGA